MTDTSKPYRCTCPPTDDPDVEIEQALACWRREQEHEAQQRRPAADAPAP